MKKLLLALVLLVSLSTFANYDPIINIPDANFKSKLLQASPTNQIASTQIPNSTNGNVTIYHKIDTNNDGEIQLSEALPIKWLNLFNSNIQSLEGILSFTNLLYLNCTYNQLTSLNIQGLTSLQILDCFGSQLTSLNLQNLINLKYIYIVVLIN